MAFQRGEIIMVYFDLPYSETSDSHPAVIISNEEVYNLDGIYIVAMLTSNGVNDEFTFQLSDEMFVKTNNKYNSQVRCHLIANFRHDHIKTGALNQLKKRYVDSLVQRISEVTLS